MGHKVHPVCFRLGTSQYWNSKWYARGIEVGKKLSMDRAIRRHVKTSFKDAIVSKVHISHMPEYLQVNVHVVKTGLAIGKQGAHIEQIKRELYSILKYPVKCEIVTVKNSEIDVNAIAFLIGNSLLQRENCRRVLIKHSSKAYNNSKVRGVKIVVSGRINGAEMANKVVVQEGCIPLHTIKNKVHYCESSVTTTYGVLGIKVYICFKQFTEDV